MWLLRRLVLHLISYMIILPVLHRWCMEQTSRERRFLATQHNQGDSKYLPAVFPPVFFLACGSECFCSGLDFSASLIMNFMKFSGSDSPSTRFLDSPCVSFLNSEYLTYKLPLHDGLFPVVSWGLSTKRTVHWDTKGSLMIAIPSLTLPACSKKTIESLSSCLGLNDSFSCLEFRLLLMTQVFFAVFCDDSNDSTSRPIRPFNLFAPIAD